jgi:hypothetical protein
VAYNVGAGRGSAPWGGIGIYNDGGVLRNCVIRGNTGVVGTYKHYGVGLRQVSGGTMNCTIVENDATGQPGGGLRLEGGGITNTIVYFNIGSPANVSKTGGSLAYSCATPLEAGTGNIDADPSFLDRAGGDLHLAPASPCIDAGSPAGAPAVDLESTPRPLDGNGDGTNDVDIGAYEANPGAGPLVCDFSADPVVGLGSLTATFTATVSGANTNDLYYWWDFGNGTDSGTGKGTVVNAYGATGAYDVSLRVSNSWAEVAESTREGYIRVVADADAHVDHAGAHTFPFDSWAKAATNIQDAVDAVSAALGLGAGHRTVWVTNDLFVLSAQVEVAEDIHVRGFGGRPRVNGADLHRGFYVSASNAVIEGFTVTNARSGENGGGVYMTGGTITNCLFAANHGLNGGAVYLAGAGRVTDCTFRDNVSGAYGGAVGMSGGTVRGCSVVDNLSYAHHARGGGVWISGGLVENCTVVSNAASAGHTEAAGGLFVQGGTVRGSLVTHNRTGLRGSAQWGGSGAYVEGGLLENCTVADNAGTGPGGGVRLQAGTVRNTIAYFNSGSTAADDNVYKAGGTFSYSCSTPLITGGSDVANVATDPLFDDRGAGDYRIRILSDCRDAGLDQPWMTGAAELDGKPRILGGRVDMGCYEATPPPAGTMFLFN